MRPTWPVATAWAKKVPTPTRVMPAMTAEQARQEQQRQAGERDGEAAGSRCARAEPVGDRAGQRRRDHRRQEDEEDEAERRHRQRVRRPHQDEADIGEDADEAEQDQEADREGAAQRRIGEMVGPGRPEAAACAAIGSGALRCSATATSAAPARFSTAKNRKLCSAPTRLATKAAVRRPIRLLATTPVT